LSDVSRELSTAMSRLREAGVDTPQLDAQLMMAHALGGSRLDVISHPKRILASSDETAFHSMLDRRATRYPLAYILGKREFFGLEIEVSPAVLIPRPETEILVEECLKRVGEDALIADIGTGSGAIAVALAVNRPRARIWATDSSEEALKVARANVEKHGVAARVSIVRGDLLEPFGPGQHVPAQQWRFDAIVSNPPYIPTGVIESLEPEVRQEPIGALDGGPDGLDAYRRLFVQAVGLAEYVAVEIGIEQTAPVTQIAKEAGWSEIEIIRDLAGIERVAIARQ
jgi:release factor glutamine methyltransferase